MRDTSNILNELSKKLNLTKIGYDNGQDVRQLLNELRFVREHLLETIAFLETEAFQKHNITKNQIEGEPTLNIITRNNEQT